MSSGGTTGWSAIVPTDDALRELLDSDALSPASRAVLVLHFQEEMELAAVAAVLEIANGRCWGSWRCSSP